MDIAQSYSQYYADISTHKNTPAPPLKSKFRPHTLYFARQHIPRNVKQPAAHIQRNDVFTIHTRCRDVFAIPCATVQSNRIRREGIKKRLDQRPRLESMNRFPQDTTQPTLYRVEAKCGAIASYTSCTASRSADTGSS